MRQKRRNYGEVFGVSIDGTRQDLVLEKIDFSLKKPSKLFITTPNPEILIASRKNSRLYDALNSSDIRICDGTGLALVLRLKGYRAQRIRGRELLIKLFEVSNKKKLKVYLLGSTQEVIESSINRLNSEYPDIKVKGNSGPVLDINANSLKESKIIEKQTVQEIKNFKPDILIVAFGAPKQEIWISKHKNELPAHIFMGVGGALDYYSGIKSVPPKLIARLGFEWLWRVVHEPKRIGRIIRAIILFPIYVFVEVLK